MEAHGTFRPFDMKRLKANHFDERNASRSSMNLKSWKTCHFRYCCCILDIHQRNYDTDI